MTRERYRLHYVWKPYILMTGTVSKKWTRVFAHDGTYLGHVVPYRLGRGWNAYRADGKIGKVLASKAQVEAFFGCLLTNKKGGQQ